jgi:2-polyprenyl-3-methyl-5-hydroxy-6-metoxy-1,4-benzoquinol methylase
MVYQLNSKKVIYDRAKGAHVVIYQGESRSPHGAWSSSPRDGADYYFATFAAFRKESFEDGLKNIKSLKGEKRLRVLDVGCAYGLFPFLVKQQGWEATGLEPDSDRAAFGQKHFQIKIHESKIEDFASDHKFDVITFWDVLEHLPEPGPVLAKVKELLEDDGILLIRVPNSRGLIHRLSFLSYWLTAGYFQLPLNKITKNHYWIYTKASLNNILKRYNFDEILSYYEDMLDKNVLIKTNYVQSLPGWIQSFIANFLKGISSLASVLSMQDSVVVYYRKQ